jgi:hypothetical protein
LRVTSGSSEKLAEVAAARPRNVYFAWQTPVRGKGYATFLRRLALGKGWTAPAMRVTRGYGNRSIWPGDTFGLSTRSGTAVVSWGSAGEIYSTRATLPAQRR